MGRKERRKEFRAICIYRDAYDMLCRVHEEVLDGMPSRVVMIEWLIDRAAATPPDALRAEWISWWKAKRETRGPRRLLTYGKRDKNL